MEAGPNISQVVVLGAGVSGLTTALVLAQAGAKVRVVARELSPDTTSDVAAAVWHPYRVGPQDLALGWGRRTLNVLRRMEPVSTAGITWTPGLDLHASAIAPEPWWGAAAPGFRRARPDELPEGFAGGFALEAPVVAMPRYLAWLHDRLLQFGGTVTRGTVSSLDDLFDDARVVVNCAGLGARELTEDEALRPVRGQIVRVAPGDAPVFLQTDDAPGGIAYVIPRPDCTVLGGTADEDAWDTTVDPATSAAIVARCTAMVPALRDKEILSHAVGLRPFRPEVRVESERRPRGVVVHNYGHGGAGVTLSWGCAEAAAELALASLRG